MKELGEVVRQLAYELFGILFPGTAMLVAISFVNQLFAMRGNPTSSLVPTALIATPLWIVLGLAYVVGHGIQGIVHVLHFDHWSPYRVFGRKDTTGFRPMVVSEWGRRHRADLPGCLDQSDKWNELTNCDIVALLSADTPGSSDWVDRMRAVAALARGMAVVSLTVLLLVGIGAIRHRELLSRDGDLATYAALLASTGCVGVWAFLDRAKAYNRLWQSLVAARWLCGKQAKEAEQKP